jgi:CRP/FNR family transcriptional regulator
MDVEILRTLRALPHFERIEASVLERLAPGCRWLSAQAGETLFLEGAPCSGFYVIVEGRVRLHRFDAAGRERVVHDFGAGQSFAEAAVLGSGRFPVTVTATGSPTRLVEVGQVTLLRLLREDPTLAPAIIASLGSHLMRLVERVNELSAPGAGERLARWLLRRVVAAPDGSREVELGMQKRELAAHLAMRSETLSRLLRRWHEAGWIRSEAGRVFILESEGLAGVGQGVGEST